MLHYKTGTKRKSPQTKGATINGESPAPSPKNGQKSDGWLPSEAEIYLRSAAAKIRMPNTDKRN